MAQQKHGTAHGVTKKAFKFASINKELVLGAIVAELLGTLVLTVAALNVGNNFVIVALVVLVVVLLFGTISGANINPAVTIGLVVNKKLSAIKGASYVVAQLLGAMLGVVIVSKFLKTGDASTSVYTLFDSQQGRLPGMWRPIFGELVGAVFFGLGIASAVIEKKEGFEKAFTLAGALLIGLVIALSGSYGVLNPAIALAVGAYTKSGWWSFLAYALAPIVGASLGIFAYKLMRSDVNRSVQK